MSLLFHYFHQYDLPTQNGLTQNVTSCEQLFSSFQQLFKTKPQLTVYIPRLFEPVASKSLLCHAHHSKLFYHDLYPIRIKHQSLPKSDSPWIITCVSFFQDTVRISIYIFWISETFFFFKICEESFLFSIKKAEHQRTDAFELWCWRKPESPLDCKEIKPVNPKGNEWSEVAQSCPTLCDPRDCSLQGSSVRGIFQARVLERVAISFSNPKGNQS